MNNNNAGTGIALVTDDKNYFAGYDAYGEPYESSQPWVMDPGKVNVDTIQSDVELKLKKKTTRLKIKIVDKLEKA